MSILQTLLFNNAADYSLTNMQIASGKAKLAVVPNPGQILAQNFNADTGFTYDAAKAEFTGGLVRQKDQRPANSVLAATYSSSKNLNWSTSGSLVATDIGTPALVAGKLACLGGGNTGVRYESADVGAQGNIGTMRIRYTPNYSGSPVNNTNIFQFAPPAGVNDMMLLFHSATGTLRFTAYTSVGTLKYSAVVFNASPWVPVAGTEYEIELNWDTVAGIVRLFIDGVLWGSMTVSSYARGTTATRLYMGAGTVYAFADASFNDIVLFNTMQHTANYTPGYTVPENIYAANTVALPNFTYTGLGGVQSIDDASTVEAGTPRYIIGGQYWNGTAWVISNGTYAQANSFATALANLTMFNTGGGTLLPVSLLFTDSNTLSSVDDLSVEVTGQKYSPTGFIIPTQGVPAQALLSFAQTLTETAGSFAKLQVKVDGVLKYWNGTAWANSDGTFAQSSTGAQVAANIATLTFGVNSEIFLRWAFTTSVNTETAELDEATLEHDFGAVTSDPVTCTVYGYYKDIEGNPVQGATVAFALVRDEVGQYKEASNNIIEKSVSKTTDVNGYFEADLIRSSEYEGAGLYSIAISKETPELDTSKTSGGDPLTFTVPDATTKDITDLFVAI